MAELQEYASGRQKDVARGAETPELAALLVEKYGYGLAKAAVLAADMLDVPCPDLISEVDRWVRRIDPNATENRQKRWERRPAGLPSD